LLEKTEENGQSVTPIFKVLYYIYCIAKCFGFYQKLLKEKPRVVGNFIFFNYRFNLRGPYM